MDWQRSGLRQIAVLGSLALLIAGISVAGMGRTHAAPGGKKHQTATPRPTVQATRTPTPTVQPTGTSTATPAPTATATGGSHAIKTVFLIVMENTNWSQVQGSASAPYINS